MKTSLNGSLAVALLCSMLVACGGSGSDSPPAPTALPASPSRSPASARAEAGASQAPSRPTSQTTNRPHVPLGLRRRHQRRRRPPPPHAYAKPGTYQVTLAVANDAEDLRTTTTTITARRVRQRGRPRRARRRTLPAGAGSTPSSPATRSTTCSSRTPPTPGPSATTSRSLKSSRRRQPRGPRSPSTPSHRRSCLAAQRALPRRSCTAWPSPTRAPPCRPATAAPPGRSTNAGRLRLRGRRLPASSISAPRRIIVESYYTGNASMSVDGGATSTDDRRKQLSDPGHLHGLLEHLRQLGLQPRPAACGSTATTPLSTASIPERLPSTSAVRRIRLGQRKDWCWATATTYTHRHADRSWPGSTSDSGDDWLPASRPTGLPFQLRLRDDPGT